AVSHRLGVNGRIIGNGQARDELNARKRGSLSRDGKTHQHTVLSVNRVGVQPSQLQRAALELRNGRASVGWKMSLSDFSGGGKERFNAAGTNCVNNAFVLGLEQIVHLIIGEAGLGDLLGIRGGTLPDAASAHEYLGLQEMVVLARLALHVIDGVLVLDVGIEAENHNPLLSCQFPVLREKRNELDTLSH